jgi:hypothetical protein
MLHLKHPSFFFLIIYLFIYFIFKINLLIIPGGYPLGIIWKKLEIKKDPMSLYAH